jgi:hypothetical protein
LRAWSWSDRSLSASASAFSRVHHCAPCRRTGQGRPASSGRKAQTETHVLRSRYPTWPCRRFSHRIYLHGSRNRLNLSLCATLSGLGETPLRHPLRGSFSRYPSCPPRSSDRGSLRCLPRRSDRCDPNRSTGCSPRCLPSCFPRCPTDCPDRCSLSCCPRSSPRGSDRCSYNCPANCLPSCSQSCSAQCLPDFT